jgi:hypothetical protein
MLKVLFVSAAKDEKIVKINDEKLSVAAKDCFHDCSKLCWGRGETKGHADKHPTLAVPSEENSTILWLLPRDREVRRLQVELSYVIERGKS